MKKISKRVRAEAIEFAGCMATWWLLPSTARCPAGCFGDAARRLAYFAHDAAYVPPVSDDEHDEWMAQIYAEAQAMLIEGWNP